MKNKLILLAMGIALSAQTLMAQVPSYVPTDGLVGYWPFNGNANDVSPNANNGTVNGATLTTDRFGNVNSAYNFDGSSKIVIQNSNTLQVTSQLSISIWFKYLSLENGINYLLQKGTGYGCLNTGYHIGFDNNQGQNPFNKTFSYGQNNNCAGIGDDSSLNSSWHNITVVYSPPNNNKIYFDGVQVGNTSFCNSCTILNTNDLLTIGAPTNGLGFALANSWNGTIDDIGIWNRALTQQEITNLFNANQCITNITVTDTLIINVGQLSFNDPVTWANNITIAPNPASTQININFNNITDLNGGSLKVINSLGQEVATTPITTSGTQSIMQLATWGGSGMYYVQIINPQGIVVDVKKIILQ